ncbi:MAG: periplasmic heavy metal sensor [Bacteroidetes bacterium]|nr:periplasmic heavy metal sensor [Bacteroidota bacterium]
MNKNRLFITLIVLLLTANVVLLVFAFGDRRHHPPRHHGPKDKIVRRLNFDEKQAGQFEILIHEHRQALHAQDDSIMNLRRELYLALNTRDAVMSDSLLNELAKQQMRIERIHFLHFKSIRALCRPEQLPAFDSFVPELSSIFNRPGPPPPPPHER